MFELSTRFKPLKTKIMNSAQKKLSRQGFFAILFISLFITTSAQTKAINKFYLQGGAGVASHQGDFSDISLQAIIKNKWSATLSYQSLTMTPKNQPADYQAETGYVFFMPYTYQATTDMSIVSLTAGRYFKLGRNTWITTEGGLSYVQGEKVSYEHSQVVSGNIIIFASTSSNYTTSKENKSSLGAALRADLTWGFASFMGLGCGVFTNINSIQSPIGFQVKLLAGYMGKEKKNKQKAAGL